MLLPAPSPAALEHRALAYAGEPLLWHPEQRQALLRELAALGAAVEDAFDGVPQDVEGVAAADGRLFVVQSRPQGLP